MSMRALCKLVLLAGWLSASRVEAAIFTVGSDVACTHGSILAAVSAASTNGPGMDEIRLANNLTYNAIVAVIVNHAIHLRGGYSSCGDTTASGRTSVHGLSAGSNATLTTSGTSAQHTLIVENLELSDAISATRRGGALRVEGNFSVSLRNTSVIGNNAARGGGIYLDGGDGAELAIDAASNVADNLAEISGGGIYCLNGGRILLQGAVIGNRALNGGSDPEEAGTGGGLALFDCLAIQQHEPGTEPGGVQLNTAWRYGGGYYLRNNSVLSALGDANEPARIERNEANDVGGGIAINENGLAGANSEFELLNGRLTGNRAEFGGGIGFVRGGTGTVAATLPTNNCHSADFCSSISFNDERVAATACMGAAAFLGPGSRLDIARTRIEGNCPSDGGWAFRQQQDAELRIDSSVIAKNGGSDPFFLELPFNGLMQISWSTIHGHFQSVTDSLFGVQAAPTQTGTLRVYGSILAEPFRFMVATIGGGGLPPITTQFDCNVVDTSYVPIPDALRSVRMAAPYGMIAPATGNYRLALGSALPVDWCDGSLGPRGTSGDADGITTVFDAPRANQFGTRDLGAYEFVVASAIDPLFQNGFE